MSGPRVLVSAARRRAGLAAVRTLGRAGYQVISADYAPFPLGLRSRWSVAFRVLPRPRDGTALLETLECSGADAVLPLDTPMVGFLATHRDRLRRRLGLAVPGREGFRVAYDKRRTAEMCQRLDIPTPALLDEPSPRDRVVVVKPRFDVGDAQGVAYCRDGAEVAAALRNCRRYAEPMFQEYVPGGVEMMRTVVVLLDRRHRLVASFTMRKLGQFPTTGGPTTMAVSTDDPALVEQVLPLCEASRWEGPAEVELKVDPRDGRTKVIEINPRFPAYLPFPIRCGLPLPQLCARIALGESPSAAGHEVGRRYVHPILHLRAAWSGGAGLYGPARRLGRAVLDLPGAFLGDGLSLADPMPRLAKMIAVCRGEMGALVDPAGALALDYVDDPVPRH